jgi:hypothetical protein
MICKTPETNCTICDCSKCQGPTDLETTLKRGVLIDNAIENTFKQQILTGVN